MNKPTKEELTQMYQKIQRQWNGARKRGITVGTAFKVLNVVLENTKPTSRLYRLTEELIANIVMNNKEPKNEVSG